MVGFNLTFTARLHQMRHDLPALFAAAGEAIDIAIERGFPIWEGYCRIVRGWARVVQGDHDDGVAEMEAGIQIWHAMGARLWLPYFLALLADACLLAGRLDRGMAAVIEAQDVADATGERVDDAELLRLRGQLRIASGDGDGGEADLRGALDLARAAGAKTWALRAATSLAEWLHERDRTAEAAELLGREVGGWPDDADTHDLIVARCTLGRADPTVDRTG
jgi:predicted ATPase